MDEKQWLECADPLLMLKHLDADPDARKTLLLTAACCSTVWASLSEVCRRWVDLLGLVAEGQADPAQLNEDWERVEGELGALDWKESSDHSGGRYYALLNIACAGWQSLDAWEPGNAAWEAARKQHAILVREVFGNPFRPLSIQPNWLTWNNALVVRVAQTAYDDRQLPAGTLDPVLLAILADALQDVGCDDPSILGHLRSPGPHVRGCHLLDALLGKG